MLNTTQYVYEKPLSTPYKKGHIPPKKKLNESRKKINKVSKRSAGIDR